LGCCAREHIGSCGRELFGRTALLARSVPLEGRLSAWSRAAGVLKERLLAAGEAGAAVLRATFS
jgi:hypothetical protein